MLSLTGSRAMALVCGLAITSVTAAPIAFAKGLAIVCEPGQIVIDGHCQQTTPTQNVSRSAGLAQPGGFGGFGSSGGHGLGGYGKHGF